MSSTALVLSTPDMEIKYSQNILLKSTADKILSRCITKWEILMNDHVFLHHNKHRWHRNTYGIRGKEYSKAAQSGIASSTVFDGPQLSIPKAKREKDRERERFHCSNCPLFQFTQLALPYPETYAVVKSTSHKDASTAKALPPVKA